MICPQGCTCGHCYLETPGSVCSACGHVVVDHDMDDNQDEVDEQQARGEEAAAVAEWWG